MTIWLKKKLKRIRVINETIFLKNIVFRNKFIKSQFENNYFRLVKRAEEVSAPSVLKIVLENKSGFFANFLWAINATYYANSIGFIPFITYSKKSVHYDHEYSMKSNLDNPFEYFFSQNMFNRSSVSSFNIFEKYGTLFNHLKSKYNVTNHYESILKNNLIESYSDIYNEYFRLKPNIKKSIDDDILKMNLGDEFIGVHFRGTDFRYNLKSHPSFITEDKYFLVLDKILDNNKNLSVFLATDDQTSLEKFIKRYGSRIKYFNDVERSSSKRASYYKKNHRKYHQFLSGYEVLRDALVLSNSKEMLCGSSNVTIAAKIFCKAYKDKQLKINLIDFNINSKGPKLSQVDKNF